MKEVVVAALACPRSFSADLAVLGFDDEVPSAVPKIKPGRRIITWSINPAALR